jgi:AcrR family transcriptional regulator
MSSRRETLARSPASRRGKRATSDAGKTTRERIMQVAERLVAERGVDAVSVRDIITAANANTAAIHYHFGSKLGLLEAILQRRAEDVTSRREHYLAELETNGAPCLRDVVAAFVQPTAEFADEESKGDSHYLGFLAAIVGHTEYMPLVLETFEEGTDRYLAVLSKVTPHLTPDVRELRWALARDSTNRLIGDPNGPVQAWLDGRAPRSKEALTERLIDFLVGAFSAPATA